MTEASAGASFIIVGMPTYENLTLPETGSAITFTSGRLRVPDTPVIPFIEGDGTGPDIWRASRLVFDGAVNAAYGPARKIAWLEVLAGEKAKDRLDSWLPEDTLTAIRHFLVAIKGPLTTPVGGGFRSLNVALRPLFHRRPIADQTSRAGGHDHLP
jgi:isocitrate dehydrogenase